MGWSVDKRFVADELMAPIVREIFDQYAAGTSYSQIDESLNARGYRTAKGKPFSKNSFAAILRNRKYIGEYLYNGGEVSVQKRLKQQRNAPARSKAAVPYLLTGKPNTFAGQKGSPDFAQDLIDILVNSVFMSNESACHRIRVVFNLTDSDDRPLSCSDLTEVVHH